MSAESVKILNTPEARARLEALGYAPAGLTPAEFTALMQAETKRWTKLIKDAGIKAE